MSKVCIPKRSISQNQAGDVSPVVRETSSGQHATLAGVYFRGIEVVELEQRIAAIEERQRVQNHQR
jgi:hypothetical protein